MSVVYTASYASAAFPGVGSAAHDGAASCVAFQVRDGAIVGAGEASLLLLGPVKLGQSPHRRSPTELR